MVVAHYVLKIVRMKHRTYLQRLRFGGPLADIARFINLLTYLLIYLPVSPWLKWIVMCLLALVTFILVQMK